MADEFEGMSDSDLDAMIYDTDVTEDGENDSSVSPTMEDSNEQTEDETEATGADQTDVELEDSEDDSTEEEQTDDNDLETSEVEDEATEDDTTDDEDKATETDDKKSEKTETFQPLKANGKEYPIDSIDELYKLASAGVGAQQKFQAIAGHRKSIMAAEKAGVDIMESVNFMANYKTDPQGAIKQLLEKNGIDPLDLDMEVKGTEAKDYSVSDFEVKYDEIVGEIGNSPKFQEVQDVLLKQWDETSRNIFFDRPEMIKQLHEEMSPMQGSDKSMWELVTPIAEKMKLSGDSRSDYEIYMDARGKKVAEFTKHEEAVKKVVKPVVDKAKVDAKKKAASPAKGKSTNSKTLDFSKLSDAELDAWLAKTN